ncbi:MAG: tail fiber domain-containing protein [Candidatus Marinimicrobia bacterium]|nr:tail fiber domain-containing protein [Candidatus Neomarinimicrobiota bacterium]
MKRIFIMIGLMIFAGFIYADTFSMQGVLRDPLGKTVADGAYQLTFSIYEQETGGSAIWSETQANVRVGHGVFGAELGLVSPLDNVPFDAVYWIGVSIEDGTEIEPRFKINRVPSAMSLYGSDKIIPAVGNMGVGTPAPQAALHIKIADAAADQLLIEGADGSDYLKVTGDGKMGVNVEDPTQALDIDGYLKMRSGGIMFADGSTLTSAAMGGSADSVSNPDTVLIIADSNGDGSGTIDLIIGSTTKMQIANNGNATTGAIKAARLIDGDDESYYVDPNGDSKLTRLGLNGVDPSDTYPLYINGNIMAKGFYDTEDPTYHIDTYGNTKLLYLGLGGNSPDSAAPLNINGSINFTGNIYKNGSLWAPTYWTETINNAGLYTMSHVGINTAPRSNYHLSVAESMGIYTSAIYFGSDWTWDHNGRLLYSRYYNPGSIHMEIRCASYNGEIQFKTGNSGNYLKITNAGFFPSVAAYANLGIAGNYWNSIGVSYLYRTNVYSLSDRRVKSNIKDLDSSLDKIMALRGVKYKINTDTHPFYKDKELKKGAEELPLNLGFIAQELEGVIPEMVAPGDKDKFYAIRNPEQMLPVIVEALQELNAEKDTEISRLEEIADRIMEKNRQLKQRIDNLKKN